MESVRRGYLYCHIRKDKDEVFYIGIGFGKNHARAYSHRSRNRYWKYIVASTDFDVEILFDNLPEKQLVEKEKEFIALYGRKDLKEGVLANMTDGGDGTIRCFFKNPVTWAKIKSDPAKYEMMCEMKHKPFNIIVKEPNKEEYIIQCKHRKDFTEKTKLSITYLHFLKDVEQQIISKIDSNIKHEFPLGTVLKYERLEKKKLVYPKKINHGMENFRKPFNIMVYDANGGLVETIFCGDNKDFKNKTKIHPRTLKHIKRDGFFKIKRIDKLSKHKFSIGNILKMNYLGKNAK
jgi:hypothetical protein